MGVKSGTGCVPSGTQVALYNGGTKPIEEIYGLWRTNLDVSTGMINKSEPVRRLLPQAFLENYDKLVWSLLSVDGTEVFPIFSVQGTLKQKRSDEQQPRLMKICFQDDRAVNDSDSTDSLCLKATEDHPVMTQANTVTPFQNLVQGNTVTTPFGVWEVKSAPKCYEDQSAWVYNLALGSREVLELLRVSLIALTTPTKEGEKPPVEDMESLKPRPAEDIVYKMLKATYAHSTNNFLGLRRREHIIFTDNVATGSFTLQHLMAGYQYPAKFISIDEFDRFPS